MQRTSLFAVSHFIVSLSLVLSTFVLLHAVAVAQDALQQPDPDGWQEFYRERASQYRITAQDDAEFSLRPEPVLRYTNPVRGRDQQGAVFVWTRPTVAEKEMPTRPTFVCTLWSISMNGQPLRRTSHEVHSLAASPLEVECPGLDDPKATRTAVLQWNLQPVEPSVALPVDAHLRAAIATPAATQPRRLLQMRSIASELSALTVDRRDGTQRSLRLMRSPLMRYADPKMGVIDGCLFAFVLATDPELLVMIEATGDPRKPENAKWHVQPIRFTGTEIRLQHGKKEIWRCDKIDYNDQTGPYRLKVGVSELPELPE